MQNFCEWCKNNNEKLIEEWESGAKCANMSRNGVYYANIFALSEKTQTIECCLK